jgi:hypothetical protein
MEEETIEVLSDAVKEYYGDKNFSNPWPPELQNLSFPALF